jgi:hypothetical protein
LLLAVLLTLLNALKPLHIDDAIFYIYAAHIAEHPLDPYDFSLMTFDRHEPANEVLGPPVGIYWWAAAIALFGYQPFLWKLWLLPFSLVLVYSLQSLFHRFATGLETPLVWMTVLSPAILPGYNLMLDVPALTLSLAAVVLFIRACDRGSLLAATEAGLVAGLAMQTKYTGFLALGIMTLYGILWQRWRLCLQATAVAILLFAAWEEFVTARYGISHFLFHLRQQGEIRSPPGAKLRFMVPLFILVGGLAPLLAPMAMVTLRAPRWSIVAAGLLAATNYLLIAFVPQQSIAMLIARADSSHDGVTVNDAVFGCLGLAILIMTAIAGWRMCTSPVGPASAKARRQAWFLAGWLGLEVAGYFLLSPYPAVRRVMGLIVVSTLIIGRLAAENGQSQSGLRLTYALAVSSIVLGLGFYGVDLCEAFAEKRAVELAAQHIRSQHPGATIWYTGFWGFQFYADKAGMKQIIPARPPGLQASRADPKSRAIPLPPPSRLRMGDWIVLADPRIAQQPLFLDRGKLEFTDLLTTQDVIPLCTVMCYYRGHTPLQHHEGPRVVVGIACVKTDFVPTSH